MEICGLDEIINNLKASTERLPQDLDNGLKRSVAKLIRLTKLKTPVGKSFKDHIGGQLRRSWHQKKLGKCAYLVYNPCEYASHIEHGFRTRQGKGKAKNYKPKHNGKTSVDGVYMLKRSLEEVEKDLMDEFELIIDKLW